MKSDEGDYFMTAKQKQTIINILIINQKEDSSFEEKLKGINLNYKYNNKSYCVSSINSNNIEMFLNILAWKILNSINNNNESLKESYSTNFINYINKNPLITIYIKEKLTEYFINNNSVLDINKFIKFNLKDLDSKYDLLLNRIDNQDRNISRQILQNAVFNDDRLKNVKELKINFINCFDINNFNCEIIADNNLKINPLIVDSTVRLYNLSPILENDNGRIKNELNSVVATIIGLAPYKVTFAGKYKMETINNIIKDVYKNNINDINFVLN